MGPLAPATAATPKVVTDRAVLDHLFAGFNLARLLAYLPTIGAVLASGDSNQHSLGTWLTFLGSNATMAAWLWEHDGRHWNRAIVTSAGNSLMCAAIVAVIVWTRL